MKKIAEEKPSVKIKTLRLQALRGMSVITVR